MNPKFGGPALLTPEGILKLLNRTVVSKVISTDETHMEIETTQRIEGWPPFTKIVRVEHFGDPEETAAK